MITDGALSVAGSASLDITPVNDAPTTTPVTLVSIVEDSGARLITQAELLANAADVDSASLTATNLAISAGNGSLVDNLDGTWTYMPALNDDADVTFSYSTTDGALSVAGSASLDITPVNDAPTTTPVTLVSIVEDSGARLITQAELLANAADADLDALTATNLAISAGNGSLVDNLDGTWTYTPALNDDADVTFSYSITDGALSVAGSASLDITPVNDAPITTPVSLGTIVEDSGTRLITQAELLTNAADVDSASITATGLSISSGLGSLIDNLNNTWTYSPSPNDDTAVIFNYTISDGALSVAGTANLDITPVNDTPVATGSYTHAVNDTASTDNFADITGNLSATDVDNATNNLVWSLSSGVGSYGDLTVNANGSYIYVVNDTVVDALAAGETASDTFIAEVVDPSGESDTRTITINLVGANESIPTTTPETPVETPVDALETLETNLLETSLTFLDSAELDAEETTIDLKSSTFSVPEASTNVKGDLLSESISIDNFNTRIDEGTSSIFSNSLRNDEGPVSNYSANSTYVGNRVNNNLDDLSSVKFELVQFNNLSTSFTVVDTFEGAIQATSAALSAGAVWWALRATGLLASVLTTVPAWQQVDLLAILPEDGDDDDSAIPHEDSIGEVLTQSTQA